METSVQFKQGVAILTLDGKLDSFTSKDFQDLILGLIAQGHAQFLVDCSSLEYVSSAGLRVFYLASNRLEERRGKMIFCGLNPDVRRVFDIVDMSSEFRIFASQEEALRQLAAG